MAFGNWTKAIMVLGIRFMERDVSQYPIPITLYLPRPRFNKHFQQIPLICPSKNQPKPD